MIPTLIFASIILVLLCGFIYCIYWIVELKNFVNPFPDHEDDLYYKKIMDELTAESQKLGLYDVKDNPLIKNKKETI